MESTKQPPKITIYEKNDVMEKRKAMSEARIQRVHDTIEKLEYKTYFAWNQYVTNPDNDLSHGTIVVNLTVEEYKCAIPHTCKALKEKLQKDVFSNGWNIQIQDVRKDLLCLSSSIHIEFGQINE